MNEETDALASSQAITQHPGASNKPLDRIDDNKIEKLSNIAPALMLACINDNFLLYFTIQWINPTANRRHRSNGDRYGAVAEQHFYNTWEE